MTEPLDTGTEPIPLTVYSNDDSALEWFPFGETLADIPGNFSSYDYIIDVWEGEDSSTLLLTSDADVDPPNTFSLIDTFREALPDFEVELFRVLDDGFQANGDGHSGGEYSIEIIGRKPD